MAGDEPIIPTTAGHFANTPYDVSTVAGRYAKTLSEIDDPYLRERALDIHDVTKRVVRNLMGKESRDLASVTTPHILIAHNLAPSDTAQWRGRIAIRDIKPSTTMKTAWGALILRQKTAEEGFEYLRKLDANTGAYAADPQTLNDLLASENTKYAVTIWTLADAPLLVEHIPDGAHGIAGFAVLDRALAGATDPDRIIVEIADDFPDRRGGMFEHGAVIGLGHLSDTLIGCDAGHHWVPAEQNPPDLRWNRGPLIPTGKPIEICGQAAI